MDDDMMIMIIIMIAIKAIMTMMMIKMTMIMEFTHQLAFLAVTEPNLEQKLDFPSRRKKIYFFLFNFVVDF